MLNLKLKKTKMIKKTLFFLLIGILIVSSCSLVLNAQNQTWPSFNVCCEKTQGNAWCQNTLQENCNDNFRISPTSCESTSFCKTGCCYDSQEGLCMKNTPQKVCNDNNGTWIDDSECNINQCELGCCVLGSQASFVSLTRCKRLSGLYGLETDFRQDIDDELTCIAVAASQDKGACVYEEDYQRNCKFTTRKDCLDMQNIGGSTEFFKDYLCSAEELGTNCGPTSKTMCANGKDEVYFQDSCGNPANIYDASKLNDKSYWKKVIDKSEACGFNSGTGNAGSKTCGNCDYFKGSICSIGDASYGDYICQDLNCYDTQDGNDYKNGESWCVYQQKNIGEGKDVIGSRHFRHICINGEEIIEPCDDYRNKVCIQEFIEIGNSESFVESGCVANRWTDCIEQDEKENCENIEKRDCYWYEPKFVEVSKIDSLKDLKLDTGVCLPNIPPGLSFWEESDSEPICDLASVNLKMEYESDIIEMIQGKNDCKENCNANTDDWFEEMNKICASLGDCGAYINLAGKATDDGIEWIIDDKEKTINKGILNRIKIIVGL